MKILLLSRRCGTGPCPDAKPLHAHNIGRRDFYRVAKRAGLSQIRLYDLRHCNATHPADQGTPVHIVQSRLGHRSPTTLRYYTHGSRRPSGPRRTASPTGFSAGIRNARIIRDSKMPRSRRSGEEQAVRNMA